jgi:tetratricopeptide (TPR) repeat protein
MKAIAVAVLLTFTSACATQSVQVPDYPDALPTHPPGLSDLDPGTMAQGGDGYLYARGIEGKPGDGFVVRYGGEWPDSLDDRPILGYVRWLRSYPGGLTLVQPEYLLPGAELNGALLEPWSDSEPPQIGKGLGQVTARSPTEFSFDIGALRGVTAGDQYLVVSTDNLAGRVGARLVGAGTVIRATEGKATAATSLALNPVTQGDWLVFVGPGRQETRPLKIQVARFLRDTDGSAQASVVDALEAYFEQSGEEKITVETVDAEFDPVEPYFAGTNTNLAPTQGHRMLVAGRVDENVITLNYASTGISVAHAMIAATPERGFILATPGHPGVFGFAVNLHAASITHRGECAKALVLLEGALRTPGWGGPARWHARDQLAMRWAQAGHPRQALWTVSEDVALAEELGDGDALVNAVGTLMPLYEALGLEDESLLAAERFYRERQAMGDGVFTMHAWKAYIDALAAASRNEEAAEELSAFEVACAPIITKLQQCAEAGQGCQWSQSSCAGDLFYAFLGYVWRTEGDERERWLGRAEEISGLLTPRQVAGLRVAQGLVALYADDYDGARIAFLEASRLYRRLEFSPGVARVSALEFNLHLVQEHRQTAYESAMTAAEIYSDLGDQHELIAIYRTLPWLYANIPRGDARMAPYIGRAKPTMRQALRFQLASGRPERVAEVFLAMGRFVMQANPSDAGPLLERAREFALRSTSFGIAARAQFLLAVLARSRGDETAMRQALEDSRDLAKIAGDPQLLQQIEQLDGGARPASPTL